MRVYVYVLEGKDFAVENSYVKVQVGKFKAKTRVFYNTKTPDWNEEFAFRIHDLDKDEVVITAYHHCANNHNNNNDSGSGSGLLDSKDEVLGRVIIPVSTVAAGEVQNLPPKWFTLEKPMNAKFLNIESGKLFLALSLNRKENFSNSTLNNEHSRNGNTQERELGSSSHDNNRKTKARSSRSHKIKEGKNLMKSIAGRFEKLFNNNKEDKAPVDIDSSDMSTSLSECEDCTDEEEEVEPLTNGSSFDESMEMMMHKSASNGKQIPENLQGGVLIDQTYVVQSKELNKFLFAPNSEFRKELSELQGLTDVREGPWTWKSGEEVCLTRVVSYTNPPSKLVKAVKATEEQTYIKADGSEFALSVTVSTPDAPYGSTFRIELLYKILPGPTLSTGEETTRLVISWGINFHQSTMMKGMIEGGARQGLKESFDHFARLLSQNFKPSNSEAILEKDQVLEKLETDHQSDWELATEYFWNFTVVSTIFMLFYIFLHILLCRPRKREGLEFYGLELPDSFGEIITTAILTLQLERVYDMASHFIQARLQRGSDHGVKAQGDGWVLTVALIEGTNLASSDSAEYIDPYVVLTCNGKTRRSSVKLHTLDPQWNEVLEFDAAEEPPSVLDVEVLDFDGPFDQHASLGHAEINFLKHTSAELADMWVPLEGKLAQSSQSKLHLRIFLDNNNGDETIKEYLHKMEKEVGKKLNPRSPHRNSTFQKIFALPPEEFLISDFACSLKRKMPLQGRLFLSARIIGFYANFFGHKTKLFFLWEDIEDIQVLPPSWASVGSPLLVMILRRGRGFDARHGAKFQDEEGRLHFYFHSFVSFHAASRTIMALWKTRTISVDEKAEIADEQQEQDGKCICPDDIASSLIIEDTNMTKVYSAEIPANITSLMTMFDGESLEYTVMEKSGCLNYLTTAWEKVTPDVYERHLLYKFNRRISVFGGEVTSTQQKFPIPNDGGWIVKESMVLHDVPFGDCFRVQLRYQIEHSTPRSCKCDVYIAVEWLKNNKFEDRVTANIVNKFKQRMKEIFEHVEREILLASS